MAILSALLVSFSTFSHSDVCMLGYCTSIKSLSSWPVGFGLTLAFVNTFPVLNADASEEEVSCLTLMVLTLGVPKSSSKPELLSILIVGVSRFFLELAMTGCLDVVGPRDKLDFFEGTMFCTLSLWIGRLRLPSFSGTPTFFELLPLPLVAFFKSDSLWV